VRSSSASSRERYDQGGKFLGEKKMGIPAADFQQFREVVARGEIEVETGETVKVA